MAGYSGTPLVQKLDMKSGMRVYFCDAPPDYFRILGRTPTIVMMTRLQAPLDFIQCFVRSHRDLEAKFPGFVEALVPDGMIWISWPKKASKVETDLTEDVVRGVALENGLVDVKVCAVDDTWSALKLVRRLKDR